MPGLTLDLVVIISLIGLAVQSIHAPSLFRSILHFVVFGLAMSLAWARLNTPDLAMAEAAIGAGVTGALVLVAFRRLIAIQPDQEKTTAASRSRLALPIALGAGLLVAVVGLAVLSTETLPAAAGIAVFDELSSTGLENPITAVLLSFRGFDTLLEITVLLAALLSAQAVTRPDPLEQSIVTQNPDTPMIDGLLAIIIPLTVLVSVHLLNAGSEGTGGAFQAGALLAAGGVILMLTGRVCPSQQRSLRLNLALLLGLLTFIAMALLPLLNGQPLLALPGTWAVYLLESTMMISIALILLLLFAGSIGLSHRRG